LYPVNLAAYAEHVTMFGRMLTSGRCLVVALGLGLRLELDLVSR